MTIGVSTVGQNRQMQALVRDLRGEINTAQVQIGNGRRAPIYSGLETEAGRSVSLRTEFNRIEAWQLDISVVSGRAEVMDNALDRITTVARDVFTTINRFPQSGEPPLDVIRDEARKALAIVQQQLNGRLGGRQLFAGTDIQNPPIDAANAAAFQTTVQAEITAFQGGQTAAATLANVNAVTGVGLGFSASLAGAGPLVARVDDGLNLDYTIRADDAGFQEIIRGLSLLANIQYTPANEAEFFNLYNGAGQLLKTGSEKIDARAAQLGLTRQILDETRVRHEVGQDLLEGLISEIEDVDVAEVATRFQNLQTQLEAVFSTIAQLRDLSLVNFL